MADDLDDGSEARELRTRLEALEAAIALVGSQATEGTPMAFGVIGAGGNFPTEAQAWYLIEPRQLSGTEAEGGTATVEEPDPTEDGFLAWNTNGSIPPTDTKVLAFHVGMYWFF